MSHMVADQRDKIITQIVSLYESGDLSGAESLCRQLLAMDGDDEIIIYLLAQIAHRRGNNAAASDWMRKLLELNPMQARYHNDFGVMRAALGQWEEAESAHRMAVVLEPDNIDAHYNLALALLRQKRQGEAWTEAERALRKAPEMPELHALRGELLRADGKTREAVEAFTRAIRLGLDTADVYVNLALAQEDLGNSGEAFDSLLQATRLNPDDAAACFYLGNIYRSQGQLDNAADMFRKAVEARPDFAEAHNNLGLIYQEHGESAMARECFEQAIEASPELDQAYSNAGNCLVGQGWMDEAIASYKKALAIRPESAEAWNNLGVVYFRLHRLAEAEQAYRKSCELQPGYIEAELNLGLLLLLQGNFSEGWPLYENRWSMPGAKEQRPTFAAPEWRGEDLNGRRLLVYCEQGMGDNIQFVRYLELLRERYPAATIYLWALAPLFRLFQPLAERCGIELMPATLPGGKPAIDFHIAMLTLPCRLGTVLDNIPARVPYLMPPPALVAEWGARLAGLSGKKVGLVWASGEIYKFHRFRTVRLKQLRSLFEVEGVSWVSLQKGKAVGEIAEAGLQGRILDPMEDVEDFADTAAIIANLDLVVSVDTSVPHLAGALGKPVWLLDRFDTDWRWLLDRSDSPWYPSMRVFRQDRFGEWGPVIERATEALSVFAGNPPREAGAASEIAAPKPRPAPLRLNLGCGNRKLDGFVNVDCYPACAPDLLVDLEKTPWPWESDSVGEIKLIHVLEHLGESRDCFLSIIKELWRVCCDGARIDIVVPHPRSDHYLGDPTHVRPITVPMLHMFDQRLNREWAAMGAANTPLGLILGVDFETEAATITLTPEWQRRVASGQVSEAGVQAAIRELNNVVEQTSIVLRVRKGRSA